MRKQQAGVMLLEALIAILIFSIGVLGIVGLQAVALDVSRDATYRADAALLANELAGQVFSGDRSSGDALKTAFQGSAGFVSAKDRDDPDRCTTDNPVTDGSMYCLWFNNRVIDALPGAANFPPQVIVLPGTPGNASEVRISVQWRAPNDLGARKYDVTLSVI